MPKWSAAGLRLVSHPPPQLTVFILWDKPGQSRTNIDKPTSLTRKARLGAASSEPLLEEPESLSDLVPVTSAGGSRNQQ